MTLNPSNVNVTTAGDHSLTTAEVLAGVITRTGPSGGFTDTFPATADLIAALGVNTPFRVEYLNASSQACTFAAADADTTIVFGAGMLSTTTVANQKRCQLLFTPSGSANDPTLVVTLLCSTAMVTD